MSSRDPSDVGTWYCIRCQMHHEQPVCQRCLKRYRGVHADVVLAEKDADIRQWNGLNQQLRGEIAAKDATIEALRREVERLTTEVADHKEAMALEVAENLRIFDAMGLTTAESFGHDTATDAIIRVYNEMKDRATTAERQLAECREAVRVFKEEWRDELILRAMREPMACNAEQASHVADQRIALILRANALAAAAIKETP